MRQPYRDLVALAGIAHEDRPGLNEFGPGRSFLNDLVGLAPHFGKAGVDRSKVKRLEPLIETACDLVHHRREQKSHC